VPTNTPSSPARDNLVSGSQVPPTMAPATSSGTGKDATPTVEDLAKRFAMMEDLLQPLQPLADTV
jgi:hypothetical protein